MAGFGQLIKWSVDIVCRPIPNRCYMHEVNYIFSDFHYHKYLEKS